MTTLDQAERELLLADEPIDESPPSSLPEQLAAVEAFIRRFVVLTSAQSAALALWVAHTHVVEASEATPYIAVTSAERRSGKTRLLEVLELLVPRPLRVANVSEAALFRAVAEQRSTLLLDEGDAVFNAKKEHEDLRALINAGYRRGSVTLRCEVQGRTVTTRPYDAFGPKVIAGIGQLPDTIADRSIPIRLQRKHRGEVVERFRLRLIRPQGEALREDLAAHAADEELLAALQLAQPALPDELDDRAQDGWEPLLAIADIAGDQWPSRARAAAVELHGVEGDTDSVGTLLLRHLKAAFEDAGAPLEMTSAEILQRLIDREDGPWPAWWGRDVESNRYGGPASRVARLLKPFAVEPRRVGARESRQRGYRRSDLEPVWARYIQEPSPLFHADGHTDTARSPDDSEPLQLQPGTSSDLVVSVCPLIERPVETAEPRERPAINPPSYERRRETVAPVPGGEHERGAPLGGELFVLAGDLGFPRTELPDRTTILGTQDCWRTFCSVAQSAERLAAFRLLTAADAKALQDG